MLDVQAYTWTAAPPSVQSFSAVSAAPGWICAAGSTAVRSNDRAIWQYGITDSELDAREAALS